MLNKDKTITGALVALLAIVLIGGAVTFVVAAGSNGPAKSDNKPLAGNGNSGNKPAKPEESIKDFTISSTTPTVFPGATVQLPLTVTNPHNFPIKVTSLKTVTTGSSIAACPVSTVTTDSFTGILSVPKNASATATVTLRMAASAPNACQGAQFTLAYSGVGEKS